MTTVRVQFIVTEADDASAVVWEKRVDKDFQFREIMRHRMNVPPGGTAKDIAPLLAEIGADATVKAIAIISDLDGVVANLNTVADVGADTDNVSVVGCYPFFFMGLEDEFSVADPFGLTIELPVGDETAHVEVVAYA